MTSLHRNTVTSAAVFFALCTATLACGPGGGGRPSYPSYSTYPSYPSDYTSNSSSSYIVPASMTQPVPVTPVSPKLATTTSLKPETPAAPQGRIKVLPATATPAAKIHLTSPVADDAKVKVVQVAKVESKAEPKTNEADAAKVLDAVTPAKEERAETSKIADALKGLVGPWMAVSRHGDGELSTVELLLNDNGWAKLTVPGADGKPSTTTRKIEFENNEIKLTGGKTDVLLGKLVEFDSRQMVLERSGSQVTFVRP